jgi:hypothetical protein
MRSLDGKEQQQQQLRELQQQQIQSYDNEVERMKKEILSLKSVCILN